MYKHSPCRHIFVQRSVPFIILFYYPQIICFYSCIQQLLKSWWIRDSKRRMLSAVRQSWKLTSLSLSHILTYVYGVTRFYWKLGQKYIEYLLSGYNICVLIRVKDVLKVDFADFWRILFLHIEGERCKIKVKIFREREMNIYFFIMN